MLSLQFSAFLRPMERSYHSFWKNPSGCICAASLPNRRSGRYHTTDERMLIRGDI